MFRALFELFLTIVVIVVARAILTSFLKGISTASTNAFQQRSPNPNANTAGPGPVPPTAGSNLHKDPVCGTYVVEATPFRQQAGAKIFYYCSEACRNKHAQRV